MTSASPEGGEEERGRGRSRCFRLPPQSVFPLAVRAGGREGGRLREGRGGSGGKGRVGGAAKKG